MRRRSDGGGRKNYPSPVDVGDVARSFHRRHANGMTALIVELQPGRRYAAGITGPHGAPLLRFLTGSMNGVQVWADEVAAKCAPECECPAWVETAS